MESGKPVEIACSSCGADTLLIRKPKYNGFTKVGETLTCASCGYEYTSEESVLFKGKKLPQVFSDADRSTIIEVFQKDEKGRICRYCLNYIVNPFTQWCSRHRKEVEATDTCSSFQPRPPPKEEKEKKPLI